jgi:hypothetical protein
MTLPNCQLFWIAIAALGLVRAFVRIGDGQVKVVLFGATGMVGPGVLRECLLDPDVETVLAIVRNFSLPQHDQVREIVPSRCF